MDDGGDDRRALFELYLGTAEKVSDRRAQANAYLLSVNSAIVALYGYLQADKAVVGAASRAVWLWAIPAAGIIVGLAWALLLASYRTLNRAKFEVLMELEEGLPARPFTREREIYRKHQRVPLSRIETAIPLCFVLLYAVMMVATFLPGSTLPPLR